MKTEQATTTSSKKQAKARSKPAAKGSATPKNARAAKATKTAKAKAAKQTARAGSKTAIVLELLRRREGATLAEVA